MPDPRAWHGGCNSPDIRSAHVHSGGHRSDRRHFAALLCATSLAFVAPLTAQGSAHRQGFFIGLGVGGGGGQISGNDNVHGSGGWLTLGGTLSPHVRLAADFEGFTPSDYSRFDVGTSTVAVLVYPSARGNFFFKGGVGAAEASTSGPDGSGIGFGTVMGAGYDFMVGKKRSITPQFTLYGGKPGDIQDRAGNPIANDVDFGVATFSVGVVFH